MFFIQGHLDSFEAMFYMLKVSHPRKTKIKFCLFNYMIIILLCIMIYSSQHFDIWVALDKWSEWLFLLYYDLHQSIVNCNDDYKSCSSTKNMSLCLILWYTVYLPIDVNTVHTKKPSIASTSSPAKYYLKKTTVPFQYWHFKKTLSKIVSNMLTMPLMYLELLSIHSIFTLLFLVLRVLRSQGKPATRKRCVLFLCSDGCCCDGIKIKALSSPPEANLSNDS